MLGTDAFDFLWKSEAKTCELFSSQVLTIWIRDSTASFAWAVVVLKAVWWFSHHLSFGTRRTKLNRRCHRLAPLGALVDTFCLQLNTSNTIPRLSVSFGGSSSVIRLSPINLPIRGVSGQVIGGIVLFICKLGG
jgi:hypothetical protein